jgi:hypothetical protein
VFLGYDEAHAERLRRVGLTAAITPDDLHDGDEVVILFEQSDSPEWTWTGGSVSPRLPCVRLRREARRERSSKLISSLTGADRHSPLLRAPGVEPPTDTADVQRTMRSLAEIKAAGQRGEQLSDDEIHRLFNEESDIFNAKAVDIDERLALQGYVPASTAPPPVSLRFRRAADLIGEPHAEPVVEGMVWPGCVTVLVSESAPARPLYSASASVADGASRHGRETVRGSVAYISYEGDAIGLRLQALHEAGHSLGDVHVLRASDPISPRVGREGIEEASFGEADVTGQLAALRDRLATEGRPPVALVVIDTVRASMTGSEDSSEHVSAYLRAARRIMATVPGPGASWLITRDGRPA